MMRTGSAPLINSNADVCPVVHVCASHATQLLQQENDVLTAQIRRLEQDLQTRDRDAKAVVCP